MRCRDVTGLLTHSCTERAAVCWSARLLICRQAGHPPAPLVAGHWKHVMPAITSACRCRLMLLPAFTPAYAAD